MASKFERCEARAGWQGALTAFVAWLWIAAAAAAQTHPAAGDPRVPFDDRWRLQGDARIAEVGGETLLEIDTGIAQLPDVVFEDGTIEVEVQTSHHRSFIYVGFRRGADGDWEEIYLRSHKSNQPDALQYTPVIGGASQWQLFHGDSGTAAVPVPAEHWIDLRLEISGRQLAVFVGNDEEPGLVIARMAHPPRAGALFLRSFIPANSAAPFGARFRHLRVTPGRTTFDFSTVDASHEADPNLVRDWQASPAFAVDNKLYGDLPAVDETAWIELATEPDGTLLLHRLQRPQQTRVYGTVLRLPIDAQRAVTKTMDLGFSDAVSVFLNERPIVSLDQSYRFDRPRVQGVMGLHQSRLHLPLEQGRNELRLVVTESFGGWGVIARWTDLDGLAK